LCSGRFLALVLKTVVMSMRLWPRDVRANIRS
jgi:hypothetical protein